ncbi:MAG: uroporphyrinogen decarboxylase family protein [Alphaproteobacteria bacterium]
MPVMTHRERVLAALNHQPTDRVPIDFGGTYTTTIFFAAYERLKTLLGVEHETNIYSKTRRLAIPDETVLRRFDVDTRFLGLGAYEGDQRELDADTYLDEWGTTWRKADDGHYLYIDGPFFGRKKPDPEDLEKGKWPDPDNPGYYRGLAERAQKLRRETDYAIILNMPIGVIHQGQFLRGFADWLKDLYKNRTFSERTMDMVADHWIRIAENALDLVDGNVDVVFFGDDLASQLAPLFNPVIYRELIKPRHARMIAAVKAKTDAKILYHSCGAVSQLIEDLIDIGVDALNPVQVTATGMEPGSLKKQFGDRITFWGGINTQNVLPFGTAEEVRAEVRRVIDILGAGGGFVLNSVHNIQNDVSAENIVAMFDEARAYGRDG